MEKDFSDFDGAFADFVDSRRVDLGKAFGRVAGRLAREEYAINSKVDLSGMAGLDHK